MPGGKVCLKSLAEFCGHSREIKSDPFFPGACTSGKTLLAQRSVEQSEA